MVMIHTVSGPLSEKSRGPQQNLGAYAPGPLGKSNPGWYKSHDLGPAHCNQSVSDSYERIRNNNNMMEDPSENMVEDPQENIVEDS